MPAIDQRVREELKQLHEDGLALLAPFLKYEMDKREGLSPEAPILNHVSYEAWYTKVLATLRQIGQDRLADFTEHYRAAKPSKGHDVGSYRLSDAVVGITFVSMNATQTMSAVAMHLYAQANIVASLASRLDSELANLRASLQATLLDNELEAATEMLRAKHLRSAGAVAGVVLERHLREVCELHSVTLAKKKAVLSDLYDALKKSGTIDVPTWRALQHLADIRNLCVHDSEREPTKDQVDDLIRGTSKMIRTVH